LMKVAQKKKEKRQHWGGQENGKERKEGRNEKALGEGFGP